MTSVNLRFDEEAPPRRLPSLSSARNELEESQRTLQNAERKGGIVERVAKGQRPEADDRESPPVYEISYYSDGTEKQRIMQQWAKEALKHLHEARNRAEAAETIFAKVKTQWDEARSAQTVDLAVAPGISLPTRKKRLQSGEEVTLDHAEKATDLESWIAKGFVIPRDDTVQIPRAQYVVASGKAVTMNRGVKSEGDIVRLEELDGADLPPEKRLERLLERGLVVKNGGD